MWHLSLRRPSEEDQQTEGDRGQGTTTAVIPKVKDIQRGLWKCMRWNNFFEEGSCRHWAGSECNQNNNQSLLPNQAGGHCYSNLPSASRIKRGYNSNDSRVPNTVAEATLISTRNKFWNSDLGKFGRADGHIRVSRVPAAPGKLPAKVDVPTSTSNGTSKAGITTLTRSEEEQPRPSSTSGENTRRKPWVCSKSSRRGRTGHPASAS